VDRAGAMPVHRRGLVCLVLPGSENRAKGPRVVGEPGRPCWPPCGIGRQWGPADEPQARGWATWADGSEPTGATQGSVGRRQPSPARGAQGVAQRPSTCAAGELASEDPVEERALPAGGPSGGHQGSTPWLPNLSPSPRWIASGVLGRPLRRCHGRVANPSVDEPDASQGTEPWTRHKVFR
jgi:hypothetical protein